MLVAIGGGEPGAFLGNDETGGVAAVIDVVPHHIDQFIGDTLGPVVGQHR